jgi:hypothetical protein
MTVKTQGGKVITKDGKVSCECCGPPICCPYPAQELLDGLYSVADLPDELIFDFFGPDDREIYTKQDPPIGSIHYISDQMNVITLLGYEEEAFWSHLYENPFCLTSNPNILDFAQSYSVSGSISGVVTRVNRCEWSGTNLILSNFNYQWKVNGNNKSGIQNTPVGSYAGGFTVS